MKVKFKKTHPDAKIPTKAHESDFCYDCTAVSVEPYKFKDDEGNEYAPKDMYLYDLGFALQSMEKTYPIQGFSVRGRSSINKHNGFIKNAPGTIDFDYTGSIKVIMWCPQTDLPMYKVGEKICQLYADFTVPIEFIEVDELDKTSRGSNGFGSSGK